jgi:uncharacterized protein (TIGR00290 family)
MKDLITHSFDVRIAGVFSAPFDETWLGRKIDNTFLADMLPLRKRYGISLTGEGGEYESVVCDAPFFSKRIEITGNETFFKNHNGRYLITKAELVMK